MRITQALRELHRRRDWICKNIASRAARGLNFNADHSELAATNMAILALEFADKAFVDVRRPAKQITRQMVASIVGTKELSDEHA